MASAFRLAKAENSVQREHAATILTKTARTFTGQVETLKRWPILDPALAHARGEAPICVPRVQIPEGPLAHARGEAPHPASLPCAYNRPFDRQPSLSPPSVARSTQLIGIGLEMPLLIKFLL